MQTQFFSVPRKNSTWPSVFISVLSLSPRLCLCLCLSPSFLFAPFLFYFWIKSGSWPSRLCFRVNPAPHTQPGTLQSDSLDSLCWEVNDEACGVYMCTDGCVHVWVNLAFWFIGLGDSSILPFGTSIACLWVAGIVSIRTTQIVPCGLCLPPPG